MMTKSLLLLILITTTKVLSSPTSTLEPPFVQEENFTPFIAPRGGNGQMTIASCNAWVRVPTGASVTFTSPNYPNYYYSKHCQWLFYATGKNEQIMINCQHFDIGDMFWSYCWGDALNVFTSVFNFKRYCGNNGPMNVESTYKWIYLYFNPSFWWDKSNTGFSCTATAVGPPTTTQPTTTTTTTTPTTTTMTTTTTLATTTPEPCKCGRKGPPTDTRIVGGKDAGLHEFPWQAALVQKSNPSQVICGAVIINNEYVLTAAHCVLNPAHLSILKLAFGEHDSSMTTETNETIYRDINTTIIRADYNFATQDNDIALIQLSAPIDLDASDAIKPICFPDPTDVYDDDLATVTGWGLLSTTGSQPNILQQVNVTTITNAACQTQYSSVTITSNMICAADPGKDSCQGDSGGPLVTKAGDHYVLVGIVSFGILCANPAYPGVYTRVGNYITWINENVGNATNCMV